MACSRSIETKHLISNLIRDIRFWIILFGLIRLFGITNPPLEVAHAWRQTTVAMVARNFYEIDSNILYPRIDISEDLTGITGMEFPLLNYLIYIVSLMFGYTHWYGRLINLIITSLGCWYFYKLLKKYFSEQVSFCSTLFLIVSIWFSYARKIMPDTFSMSLIIMGMYFGTNYIEKTSHSIRNLLLYSFLSFCGILSKLPSGFILSIFALLLLNKEFPLRRKIIFCLVSMLYCVPVAFWYFYWVPYLVEEYGLWHFFMGKDIATGTRELVENWNNTLAHFYDHAMKFIGFGVFLIGLIYCIIRKEKLILRILAIGFFSFLIVMMKAGWTFSHHIYYIIPFVPIMALVAGYGVSAINKSQIRIVLIAAVILENTLNQHNDFIIHDDRIPILKLEEVFDSFSQPSDLIVFNSGQIPVPMYFAHRKGWVASNEQLSNADFLNDINIRGCKYVVILKKVYGSEMQMSLDKIIDNEDYTIYELPHVSALQ